MHFSIVGAVVILWLEYGRTHLGPAASQASERF
jgi:hypothetical protein